MIAGGQMDRDELYIAPTVLTNVPVGCALLQEEIFGPLLPVVTYETIEEAIEYVEAREHPLALYVFSSSDKVVHSVIRNTTAGGMCVNDTLMHVANHNLPFGGVGEAGYGACHGRPGFVNFSHTKPVVNKPTWLDPLVRYAPYSESKLSQLRIVMSVTHVPAWLKAAAASLVVVGGAAVAASQGLF